MNQITFNRTEVKRTTKANLSTFTSDRMVAMEGCVDFLPSPKPTVEEMGTLRVDFMTAEATYKNNDSERNKQLRDTAFEAVIKGHLAWIAYAEPLIGNDKNKADLLGYPQAATRTAAEVPQGQPAKPKFDLTVNPGEIILYAQTYKQGSKAIYYNWQVSEDGGASYTYLPSPNGSHRRRIKLEYGKSYQFRVAYATTAGEGPFSPDLDVVLTKDMVKQEKKQAA